MKSFSVLLTATFLATTSFTSASLNLLPEDDQQEIKTLTQKNSSVPYTALSLEAREQSINNNIQYYEPMQANSRAVQTMAQYQDLGNLIDALKQKFYGTTQQNKTLFNEFLQIERFVEGTLYTKITTASSDAAASISNDLINWADNLNRIRKAWKF